MKFNIEELVEEMEFLVINIKNLEKYRILWLIKNETKKPFLVYENSLYILAGVDQSRCYWFSKFADLKKRKFFKYS